MEVSCASPLPNPFLFCFSKLLFNPNHISPYHITLLVSLVISNISEYPIAEVCFVLPLPVAPADISPTLSYALIYTDGHITHPTTLLRWFGVRGHITVYKYIYF